MGKKKSKVKWTAVDSVPVNFSSRSELDGPQVRGRDTFKGNETLPPRFERKAAQKKNLVYYDGQFCETEELPNGFVKVRSKHLDVLFKRDFYTKKMERLFSPNYKRTNPEVFHSQLEEVREELTHYSCHNSSDGSIIYNIDHLLVSSNVSFEMSTNNPTANQSANTSQEVEEAVNDFGQIKDTSGEVMEENVDETHHQDSGFAETLMNPSPGKTRHDSGFIDSANIPFQSCKEEPEIPEPCWDSQFLSQPAVYVYIPSGNELIPCEEVFVSPPGPRDPRCTCPPQTSVFLTGSSQNREQLFQAGHPAAPRSQYHAAAGLGHPSAPDFRHHASLDPSYHATTGPPYNAASGFPDHATFRPPYHATDGYRHNATSGPLDQATSRPPHHAPSGHHSVPLPGQYTTPEDHGAPGFVNGLRLNPTEYVENNNFFNYDYNNINRIPMDDPNGLRYGPFVPNYRFIPFQQPQGPAGEGPNQIFHMDENEKDEYFDYDKPLLTSQPNDVSTKRNTYQLFSVDEKLHPVFGFNTSPSLVSNNDQASPKKVIEPDYDWIKQLDEIEPKKRVIRANNSETRKMDSYSKQESAKSQTEVPSLKSPIPGLPLESLVRRKTQKKKKRKRKNTNDAKSLYSSDETGNGNGVEAKLDEKWFSRDHPNLEVGFDMDSVKLEPHFELTSMKASFEVELSDALASSLVDPLAHFSSENVDNLNIQQVLINSMADLVFDIVDDNHGRELEVVNELIPTEKTFKKDTAAVHEKRNEENDADVHLESNVDSFKTSSNNPITALLEHALIKKTNNSLEEFPPTCMEKKKQSVSEQGSSDKIRMGGDTVPRDEIALILEELISAAVKYDSDSKEDQNCTGNQKYKGGCTKIMGTAQPKVGAKSKEAKYIGSDQNAIETSQPKSDNLVKEDVEVECSKQTSHHFISTPKEKQLKEVAREKKQLRKEKQLKGVVAEEKQLTKEKQLKVVTKEKHFKAKDDKSSTQNPTLSSTEINRKGNNAKKAHSSFQETGKADCSIQEKSEKGSKLDEEETDISVKRTKRRSKKEKSKCESVHRVIIDDSKVEVDLSRRVYPLIEPLTPKLIELLQMNRFEDDIFVESLGFGMDHGWITQSRLPPSYLLQDLRSSSGNEESGPREITVTRELGEGNGDIGLD